MKKIALFVIGFALLFMSCEASPPTARDIAETAQKESAIVAVTAVPIPTVSYFQEKRTIAKWAQRWDKPSVPTYVYLVSFGKVLGYYVCDGKPASTRSYLMPEETIVDDPYGTMDAGGQVVSTPDIDGTYGENNIGIRFFTSDGIAVEWAGDGASYLYSDAPMDFGYPVPRLSKK